MALIALLTNPGSTGNKSLLAEVRAFCAGHPDVFHVEVEKPEEMQRALTDIAAVSPSVLVVNGGDGTVQAALTELVNGGHFPNGSPPIAVLPNGKTNLIAKDLGARGDPVAALELILQRIHGGLDRHLVLRDLISLDDGNGPPALGMFLAAGALADTILFCRHNIYPLGLPNGVSHFLAVVSGFLSVFTDRRARFLPPPPVTATISIDGQPPLRGFFQILMVTTLHDLLLTGKAPVEEPGRLNILAVERRVVSVFRAIFFTLRGKLGGKAIPGVHVRSGTEIRLDADRVTVVLDGELFEVASGRPIVLTRTEPVRFLSLAA